MAVTADQAPPQIVDRAEDLVDADESGNVLEPKAPSLGSRHSKARWARVVAFGLLPALAMVLALAAGYLKWQAGIAADAQVAATQAVRAASDGTVALLSYRPDTAEKDLGAARDLLTGDFLDSYTRLTRDVVIPGAKQKHVTAVASVPAAASVATTEDHAVVLVFVNQTLTVGTDAPSNTASSVKVTLDRYHGRWLMAGFDPM